MTTAEFIAALSVSGIKLDFFLYIGSTPAVRLWSGLSSYDIAPDGVDLAGGSYLGLGRLQGIPALQQLINGAAERVEFALSGVDATAVALADESSASLRNVPVHLGLALWSQYDQLLGDQIFWLWQGVSDAPRVSSQPGQDGVPLRQVVLSVASLMSSRRRPRLSYWTNIEHQLDHPGDTFFSQVALYNVGTTIRWPR